MLTALAPRDSRKQLAVEPRLRHQAYPAAAHNTRNCRVTRMPEGTIRFCGQRGPLTPPVGPPGCPQRVGDSSVHSVHRADKAWQLGGAPLNWALYVTWGDSLAAVLLIWKRIFKQPLLWARDPRVGECSGGDRPERGSEDQTRVLVLLVLYCPRGRRGPGRKRTFPRPRLCFRCPPPPLPPPPRVGRTQVSPTETLPSGPGVSETKGEHVQEHFHL